MPGPAASGRFEVGAAAPAERLFVTQHEKDKFRQRGAQYKDFDRGFDAMRAARDTWTEQVFEHSPALAAYGYAELRVYGASDAVEVLPLQPLTQVIEDRILWDWVQRVETFHPSMFAAPRSPLRITLRARPSGFAGSQVEWRSGGEDDEEELLEWEGTREVDTARLPAAPPEVLVASQFIDATGATLPPPVHVGQGRYRAARPAFGALMVRYRAPFRRVRVYYDVPEHRTRWYLDGAGNSELLDPLPVAPLLVVVRDGARMVLVKAERAVQRWSVKLVRFHDRDADEAEFDGTESEADLEQVPLPVKNSSGETIGTVTLSRPRWLTFQDDAGRTIRLRRAG